MSVDEIIASERKGAFGFTDDRRCLFTYGDFRRLLMEIEAAWKREYDILNSEREKSRLYGLHEHDKVLKLIAQLKASGNAAALREAVERVKEIAIREWNAFRETAAMKEMHDICEVALSKPPRNCDVGTAEEQDDRFVTWRYSKPLREEFGLDALAWAQLPYEEGGAE